MSLKDWKNLYYSVDARTYRPMPGRAPTRVQQLLAVNHSIKKWLGLSKLALANLFLRLDGRRLCEDYNFYTGFSISANNCALCHQFVLVNKDCNGCPLAEARWGRPCDRLGLYDLVRLRVRSPYIEFLKNGNTKPMLDDLLKTRHNLLQEIGDPEYDYFV